MNKTDAHVLHCIDWFARNRSWLWCILSAVTLSKCSHNSERANLAVCFSTPSCTYHSFKTSSECMSFENVSYGTDSSFSKERFQRLHLKRRWSACKINLILLLKIIWVCCRKHTWTFGACTAHANLWWLRCEKWFQCDAEMRSGWLLILWYQPTSSLHNPSSTSKLFQIAESPALCDPVHSFDEHGSEMWEEFLMMLWCSCL